MKEREEAQSGSECPGSPVLTHCKHRIAQYAIWTSYKSATETHTAFPPILRVHRESCFSFPFVSQRMVWFIPWKHTAEQSLNVIIKSLLPCSRYAWKICKQSFWRTCAFPNVRHSWKAACANFHWLWQLCTDGCQSPTFATSLESIEFPHYEPQEILQQEQQFWQEREKATPREIARSSRCPAPVLYASKQTELSFLKQNKLNTTGCSREKGPHKDPPGYRAGCIRCSCFSWGKPYFLLSLSLSGKSSLPSFLSGDMFAFMTICHSSEFNSLPRVPRVGGCTCSLSNLVEEIICHLC